MYKTTYFLNIDWASFGPKITHTQFEKGDETKQKKTKCKQKNRKKVMIHQF